MVTTKEERSSPYKPKTFRARKKAKREANRAAFKALQENGRREQEALKERKRLKAIFKKAARKCATAWRRVKAAENKALEANEDLVETIAKLAAETTVDRKTYLQMVWAFLPNEYEKVYAAIHKE